jgi:hypothetical protein
VSQIAIGSAHAQARYMEYSVDKGLDTSMMQGRGGVDPTDRRTWRRRPWTKREVLRGVEPDA